MILPEATLRPGGSYDWRKAEREDRLVFPTATLEPTFTPRPTKERREIARLLTPVVKVVEVGGAGLVEEEVLSCQDRFRRSLIGYDGRALFGSEVAYRLSREMVENHPECGGRGVVPGVRAGPGVLRYEGGWGIYQPGVSPCGGSGEYPDYQAFGQR